MWERHLHYLPCSVATATHMELQQHKEDITSQQQQITRTTHNPTNNKAIKKVVEDIAIKRNLEEAVVDEYDNKLNIIVITIN